LATLAAAALFTTRRACLGALFATSYMVSFLTLRKDPKAAAARSRNC
jgi:hypothetical protein